MPGHIKLVKGAVDPDPTEFLYPSMDMKKADQAKPYDPKGSVWIMDQKTHGYKEGILEVGNINLEDPNEKCVVACDQRSLTSRQLMLAVSIRQSSRSARTWSTSPTSTMPPSSGT